MYRPFELEVFVDLSTLCNAGCPQCHRTSTDNKLKKVDWLPLLQWSLEDFQKAFPPDCLDIISKFSICGTWGDPVMNKDIKEIIEYITKTNSKVLIHLDTNGSIRDEQWWWELGVIAGKNLRVVFAVDGSTQEMHQKYRKFTNLDKVLKNMQAISETNSFVEGHTILFKHNQDFIHDIKKLCLEYGANSYRLTTSDRFDSSNSTEGKYFHFENEKGEKDMLEITSYESPNSFISHTNNKKELEKEIKCRWKYSNRILVNIDGQVYPCCYIVNSYYKSHFVDRGIDIAKHSVMKEYAEHKDEHNIFKNDLRKIITESKWFNQTLPESWTGNNPIEVCVKNCSSLINTKHQLKSYL